MIIKFSFKGTPDAVRNAYLTMEQDLIDKQEGGLITNLEASYKKDSRSSWVKFVPVPGSGVGSQGNK